MNFVNSSIHYSGLKYPPSCFSVYLENKNAYLKQETSEIVVKSIHHGGFLFNFIIINLKPSENKERRRLSTVSYMFIVFITHSDELFEFMRISQDDIENGDKVDVINEECIIQLHHIIDSDEYIIHLHLA